MASFLNNHYRTLFQVRRGSCQHSLQPSHQVGCSCVSQPEDDHTTLLSPRKRCDLSKVQIKVQQNSLCQNRLLEDLSVG